MVFRFYPRLPRPSPLAVLVVLPLLLSVCGGDKDEPLASEDRNTLVLAYDGWSGTYLPMYVLKAIFEEELGYTVKISDQSTIPDAFESVASGETDMFTSAWFPARDFTFAKYPNLVKLGQVYGGKARDAYEGWMVPADISEEFNLTHVRDLKNPEVAKALDTDGDGKGDLIGCPGTWICAKRNPEILAGLRTGGALRDSRAEFRERTARDDSRPVPPGPTHTFLRVPTRGLSRGR